MPHFKEPKPKHQKEELELNERYKSISDEYAALGYTYVLSPREKEELIFERYKAAFPKTYRYALQHAYRIKHEEHEYLVYRIIEEVTDNNGTAHTCERQIGWHSSPIARMTKNQLGEVTSSEIQGHKLIYEIPYEPDLLRELIQGSWTQPGDLCVGIGNTAPPEIISSNPQKINNKDDFLEYDFDTLYGASISGFSWTDRGGVEKYREAQAERLKSAHHDVDEEKRKHDRKMAEQQRASIRS